MKFSNVVRSLCSRKDEDKTDSSCHNLPYAFQKSDLVHLLAREWPI